MNEPKPTACSLSGSALRRRLEEIAALGADALIAEETSEGVRVLRFRDDADTRRRLEQIVAAESECCPFLDLRISKQANELLLTIDA